MNYCPLHCKFGILSLFDSVILCRHNLGDQKRPVRNQLSEKKIVSKSYEHQK